jgi:hypothetical protein
MHRYRKLMLPAVVWLAFITLAAPDRAAAQDCEGGYIECWLVHGGSTFCLHEYIRCLSGAILDF